MSDADAAPDACIEAVGDLAPRLLRTLAMLEYVQRQLDPATLADLTLQLQPLARELTPAAERFAEIAWPEQLAPLRDRMLAAATLAAGACAGLEATRPKEFVAAFRALRRHSRALETLYPLGAVLPPISRFFLERELDEDIARTLVARLGATGEHPRSGRGIFHTENERQQRGGWSVYVPEWVPDDQPMPLLMALHGGSGHGRDFLHAWLREARTRGCVLIAPTSPQHTWSFPGLAPRGEDTDAQWLFSLVAQVQSLVPIDADRMLLTGMSDGGSYSLLAGLRPESPFTALAPFSCVLSPDLIADGRISAARGLPIRLVHGARDWMFPLSMGQEAARALETAGARLEYVELEDLSHTYAREENPKVLDWFGVAQPSLDQMV